MTYVVSNDWWVTTVLPVFGSLSVFHRSGEGVGRTVRDGPNQFLSISHVIRLFTRTGLIWSITACHLEEFKDVQRHIVDGYRLYSDCHVDTTPTSVAATVFRSSNQSHTLQPLDQFSHQNIHSEHTSSNGHGSGEWPLVRQGKSSSKEHCVLILMSTDSRHRCHPMNGCHLSVVDLWASRGQRQELVAARRQEVCTKQHTQRPTGPKTQ